MNDTDGNSPIGPQGLTPHTGRASAPYNPAYPAPPYGAYFCSTPCIWEPVGDGLVRHFERILNADGSVRCVLETFGLPSLTDLDQARVNPGQPRPPAILTGV